MAGPGWTLSLFWTLREKDSGLSLSVATIPVCAASPPKGEGNAGGSRAKDGQASVTWYLRHPRLPDASPVPRPPGCESYILFYMSSFDFGFCHLLPK